MQNKTSKKYLLAPFLPFPENQEGWFSINVFLKGRWSHGGGGNFSFYWRASSFRGVAPGALNVVHGSSGCEHVWERLYWPCLETQSNYNAGWNEPKANRMTSYKRRGLLFFFSPLIWKRTPMAGPLRVPGPSPSRCGQTQCPDTAPCPSSQGQCILLTCVASTQSEREFCSWNGPWSGVSPCPWAMADDRASARKGSAGRGGGCALVREYRGLATGSETCDVFPWV